ncbi:MAG: phospholipase/carboxylesterase [Candidatus Azotimanducaceae bacterium]|jgi:phospholipase/carboxylesterase
MTATDNELMASITRTVPALLTTMEAFEQIQANMHPRHIAQMGNALLPFEIELQAAFEEFCQIEFPEDIAQVGATIRDATRYCLRACDGLTREDAEFGEMMKAMRAHCRAQEIIYTLAPAMTPVNQYFLEPSARANRDLMQVLASGGETQQRGILSSANARHERGGFSTYIPENLDPSTPVSVVIALHGGTGHGADFLWSWLREARSRGFILVAPTSMQDTWSLMGEEHDLPRLLAIVDYLRQSWRIDEQHILLAGMSDGATYTLMAASQPNSPFTHLAPFSGVLHPDLVTQGRLQHLKNKPIYLVHGTEDWMFPVEAAHMAKAELTQIGANLTYREIPGLSHHFARSECPAMLQWFNPALSEPRAPRNT